MFKSKGLIVHWPDVAEGETAPMQFGHEVGKQAANMRRSFNTNFRGTYNRVCKITSKKHRWIIRIVTALDYTNPKTGVVTTEYIKSVLDPREVLLDANGEPVLDGGGNTIPTGRPFRGPLNSLASYIEEVQREDMTTPVKKFAGRTIECFCKD